MDVRRVPLHPGQCRSNKEGEAPETTYFNLKQKLRVPFWVMFNRTNRRKRNATTPSLAASYRWYAMQDIKDCVRCHQVDVASPPAHAPASLLFVFCRFWDCTESRNLREGQEPWNTYQA